MLKRNAGTIKYSHGKSKSHIYIDAAVTYAVATLGDMHSCYTAMQWYLLWGDLQNHITVGPQIHCSVAEVEQVFGGRQQ